MWLNEAQHQMVIQEVNRITMRPSLKLAFMRKAVTDSRTSRMTIILCLVLLLVLFIVVRPAVPNGALGGGWIESAVLFFAFAFAPTGLLVAAVVRHLMARRLDCEGVLVEGMIVHRYAQYSDDYLYHYVVYSFSHAHQAKQEVLERDYERLQVGDRVMIRHLPSKPRYSRLEL